MSFEMGTVPDTCASPLSNRVSDSCRSSCHEAVQESVEDRFELIKAAGMGFFGIVFYALLRSGFLNEQSLLIKDSSQYDRRKGLPKVQAVKICNPLCPSGIKSSAKYIIKDITALKKIWVAI